LKKNALISKMIRIILKALNEQIIRFFLVAVLNTLFGYGFFALLIYLKFHYSIAILLSTIAGILFNFKTYGSLVFNSRENNLIVRFISIYMIAYLFNIAGLALFEFFKINNYIAGIILVVPIGLLSFSLNKRFVFVNSK